MQKTLYALVELQEIDNRLDELKAERGDLPLIVEELENKLNLKKSQLEQKNKDLKASKVRQKELELIIEEAKTKLGEFEEKLYQVKTNREYDAIMSETDTTKAKLDESEDELLMTHEQIEKLNEAIAQLKQEVEKISAELEENRIELSKKLTATAEEENLLNQERDIIINKTKPEIIKTYELVRAARDGKGIARVENGVCGGCYSYIPPQKIVEVKKMEKIYTCEFCGRILVYYE
ncbi:MAG: hypothetical protein GXO77_12165 [Calditrichaeota bacterium]|nr:hypothetical protein [Calditrichota bacterium]